MPVTAKLSKQFYDRLGEAVTNELVDWFNQVDASYKADLREMNELNFARFDAKLEQRVTSLEAKLDQRITSLEAKLDQRITSLEAKLDAKIDVTAARLTAALEKALREQTRFFFLAWAVLLASNIALSFR